STFCFLNLTIIKNTLYRLYMVNRKNGVTTVYIKTDRYINILVSKILTASCEKPLTVFGVCEVACINKVRIYKLANIKNIRVFLNKVFLLYQLLNLCIFLIFRISFINVYIVNNSDMQITIVNIIYSEAVLVI